MNIASRIALTLAVGLGLVTPESRTAGKRAADSVVAPPAEDTSESAARAEAVVASTISDSATVLP